MRSVTLVNGFAVIFFCLFNNHGIITFIPAYPFDDFELQDL